MTPLGVYSLKLLLTQERFFPVNEVEKFCKFSAGGGPALPAALCPTRGASGLRGAAEQGEGPGRRSAGSRRGTASRRSAVNLN